MFRTLLYSAIAIITSAAWSMEASQVTAPDRAHYSPYSGAKHALMVKNMKVGVEYGHESVWLTIDQPDAPDKKIVDLSQLDVKQVESLHKNRAGDLIAVGRTGPYSYKVVIVQMDRMRIADSFMAYRPSVSPDGAYVSFIRFYPPHAYDEDQDDCYLLYKTGVSPEENRPKVRSFKGYQPHKEFDVGAPILPRPKTDPMDSCQSADSSIERGYHKMAATRFTWSSDSRRLAFSDRRTASDHALVLVSLSDNDTRTSESVSIAPLSRYCTSDDCHLWVEELELLDRRVNFKLRHIQATTMLSRSSNTSDDISGTLTFDQFETVVAK